MSSCVSAPAKQNELVVKTGFEVRLRKVDFSKLRGRIVVITNLNSVDEFGSYLKKCSLPNSSWFSIYTSILDVEKPNRGGSAAILCYDEPSYNGMQCLYHMFGQRLGLTSYDMFKQVVQHCQKNGEAIVFTRDELMWCPSPKVMAAELVPEVSESQLWNHTKEDEFPDSVLRTLETFDPAMTIHFSTSTNETILYVANLPYKLREWVHKYFPETDCVLIQIDKKEGGVFYKYKNATIWGWEKQPLLFKKDEADWRKRIYSENWAFDMARCRETVRVRSEARDKEDAAAKAVEEMEQEKATAKQAAPDPVVALPASSPAPTPEPTIQSQLVALTAAITALTKLVETRLAPPRSGLELA